MMKIRRAPMMGLVSVLAFLPLTVCVAPSRADVPAIIAVTGPGVLPDAREPQVAVTRAGSVYITYGAGDAVYCSASSDGGKTYGAPVKVADAGKLSLGMRRGPRIAVAGNTLVISAIYGQQGKGRDGELLSWRSGDNGRTWSGPARVSDVPGAAREGLHGMTGSPDGRLLACVWLDLRGKGTQIYASRSRDGGMTWDKNTLVYRSPDGTVCECCHPSVAFDAKGDLIVMWRNALGGARDMFLARSTGRGITFSPAQKLGQGTWPLNACPMDGGALAVAPSGEITTFWRRDQDMFLCIPDKPERLIGRGQQGWAAAGRDGTHYVWLEGRPGRLRSLYLEGRMGQYREVSHELAVGADDPVVVTAYSGDGPVIAAWTVKRQGIQSSVLTSIHRIPR